MNRHAAKPIDSILRVSGTQIVDGNRHQVVLKGAGLGGHLNTSSMVTPMPVDFSRFPDTPLPNSVYACHDYSMMGFPGQEAYLGTPRTEDEAPQILRA